LDASGGSSGGGSSGAGSSGSSAGGSSSGASSSGGGGQGTGCTPPTNYPNLFATILGQTQSDVDAKITAGFTQLFHDPANKNNVYYTGPGTNEAYVEDIADNDVRTEGMSYGMMIAVQLGKQTEFDALWTFVKNHMAQMNGQFAWHTTTSGQVLGAGSAPDGDEYFATALIFASNRWGDASGAFNYANEANAVLTTVKSEFNQNAQIVAFGVGSSFTDGSYVLPAFVQTWACFDTANQSFWQSAVDASRAFFQNAANTSTGIIPDHSSFSGQPMGNAGSDALRCVANVMMDHNFFDADPWQTTYATKLAAFFKSQGPNYTDSYTPSGTPSGGSHSTSIVACNALLGFGVPTDTATPFVQELWTRPIPTGQYRYYDGMLYMLALLHVSGTFHLYY
jgi:oligosaccharide reducing-end xylanase